MLKKDIEIGKLAIAYIQKSDPFLPGFTAYLPEYQKRAILPLENVARKNRIGEYTWALMVSELETGDVQLSQTAESYFRQLMDCFLLASNVGGSTIRVMRVAHVSGNQFVKIAVDSQNGVDPVFECRQACEHMKKYTDFKIIIVKYERDKTQYIKNALYPCPKNAIREVIYKQDERTAIVKVKDRFIGLCKGDRKTNVTTASKLTGLHLVIKSESGE